MYNTYLVVQPSYNWLDRNLQASHDLVDPRDHNSSSIANMTNKSMYIDKHPEFKIYW